MAFNKIKNKFIIILSVIMILSLIATLIFYHNFVPYYILEDYPDSNKICYEKKLIWDKGIYPVSKTPHGKKIVLKVENRNKDAWSAALLPIQSPTKQFKTCTKGIIKYPKEVEDLPTTPLEIKQKSKGLELSIGIQEPFKYTPVAHLAFTMRLFSNRFNNDGYNLDVAIQNITENITLIQESNNSWRLHINTEWRNHLDKDLPFDYYLVKLNGKDVNQNNSEFISKDNGKTWKPITIE